MKNRDRFGREVVPARRIRFDTKRELTTRETLYIGGKCHYDKDGSECWAPATHRVQNGSGGGAGGCWWFVCFDHIEAVARVPADGRKARVRHLALSPAQAAGAQLIARMGMYARSVIRWNEGRCTRCGGELFVCVKFGRRCKKCLRRFPRAEVT